MKIANLEIYLLVYRLKEHLNNKVKIRLMNMQFTAKKNHISFFDLIIEIHY